jgi:hypothetical protein
MEDNESLLRVGSVQEEYRYIQELRCDRCGGEYRTIGQALIKHPGEPPTDKIELECEGCGQARTVAFDISSFFGKL